jgi:transposase InsO family protein
MSNNKASIYLPIKIHQNTSRNIPITALIDSGAQGNFVSKHFIDKHELRTQDLKNPIKVNNADGTQNENGHITKSVHINALIDGKECQFKAFVTGLGSKDLILGYPWLEDNNPDIDWTKKEFKWRNTDHIIPLMSKTTHSPMAINEMALDQYALNELRCEPDHYTYLDDLDQNAIRIFEDTVIHNQSDYSIEELQNYLENLDLDEFSIEQELGLINQSPYELEINAKIATSAELSNKYDVKAEFKLPRKFRKFAHLFDAKKSERFPPTRPYDHKIDLKPSFESQLGKTYPLSPKETEELQTFIDENLKKGYIRPSESPMASSFFFVGKKDGKLRPCQDYRYLNSHTVKNAYPIPMIPTIMDKLKGANFFTKMDVRLGYNNIRIRNGDQWKAAFKTPLGFYEPMVMFFGMCNSPATFQKMMDTIFEKMLRKGGIIIYMDDILIFAKTQEELDRLTLEALQILENNDLYLKLEKCEFDKQRLEYLGMIITPNHIEMDNTKLKGINEWPTPKNTRDVRKFMGFCNFYRKFIHHYADISRPLNKLLSKTKKFEWENEAEEAFYTLKEAFTKKPVLQMADQTKPFEIESDASKYASGAILTQKDINGNRHPIAYLSKSFSPTERNYEIHDRELLAIIRALEEWRHYLEGSQHEVIVRTDHQNLTFWRKPQNISRRQARWLQFLSRFDFKIEHIAGTKIPAADALSRRPDHEPDEDNDNENIIVLPEERFIKIVDTELQQKITSSTEYDEKTLEALKQLQSTEPKMIDSKYELLPTAYGNLLTYDKRLVIPEDLPLRREILTRYHDHPSVGHPGEQETLRLARKEVYWPGMNTFIKNYVKGCAKCQQYKINRHPSRPPLHPVDAPKSTRPFSQISMDLLTDLPKSRGFDCILSIVDHGLTKGIILCPTTKTATAKTITDLFMEKVYSRFGIPDKIISDRDPRFMAKSIRTLFKHLGTKQAFSSAYHPQSDGTTERFNQEISAYLSIYCTHNPLSWVENIPTLEFAHNSKIHSDRKMTPFELMYGTKPHGIPSIIEESNIESTEQRIESLDHARKEAIAAHNIAKERMEQRIKSTFKPFVIGQKVWLEARNLKLPFKSGKIAPKRVGPYPITRVISPLDYELRLPDSWRIHNVFHAVLLTPYLENDIHGPNDETPSPDLIEGNEEYEVEGIINHRTKNGQDQFYIKWKDYNHEENSWMTEDDLAPHSLELLNDYRKENRLKPFDKSWDFNAPGRIKVRPL